MQGEEALRALANARAFWQSPPMDYVDAIVRDLAASAGARDKVFMPPGDFVAWCRGILDRADPVWVAPDVTRLILTAAETMPPLRLQAEHVPPINGFLWLAQPIPFDDEHSGVQGLQWFPQRPGETGQDVGLTIHQYSHAIDGRPVFMGLSTLRFGEAMGEVVNRANASHAAKVECVLATFFLFIQQQILDTSPRRIQNKNARRRYAQLLNRADPAFQVVDLHRPRSEGTATAETEPLHWRYQWLVSGHWRQQWMPSRGIHEPRWIGPYVKGPANRPFKPPSQRLYVVRR